MPVKHNSETQNMSVIGQGKVTIQDVTWEGTTVTVRYIDEVEISEEDVWREKLGLEVGVSDAEVRRLRAEFEQAALDADAEAERLKNEKETTARAEQGFAAELKRELEASGLSIKDFVKKVKDDKGK